MAPGDLIVSESAFFCLCECVSLYGEHWLATVRLGFGACCPLAHLCCSFPGVAHLLLLPSHSSLLFLLVGAYGFLERQVLSRCGWLSGVSCGGVVLGLLGLLDLRSAIAGQTGPIAPGSLAPTWGLPLLSAGLGFSNNGTHN